MIRPTLFLALSVGLALAACKDDGPGFTQISYFKSDNRHRVFVHQATDVATADQVKSYAGDLMNTEGRFTAAFIYEATAQTPPDLVTLQPDFVAAQTEMMDGQTAKGWRWYYLRQMNGDVVFRDCVTEPETDLSDICNR